MSRLHLSASSFDFYIGGHVDVRPDFGLPRNASLTIRGKLTNVALSNDKLTIYVADEHAPAHRAQPQGNPIEFYLEEATIEGPVGIERFVLIATNGDGLAQRVGFSPNPRFKASSTSASDRDLEALVDVVS